jgi:hypothetical protein
MSKQIRLVIIALAGISLSFTCLWRSAAKSTLRVDPQTPATAVSRNSALVAATQEVLKETSEVRQLSILRSVRSSAQSRAEIESMIKKNLDKEMTPARIHTTEVTLKKLGLAPADFQYRALMISLLTEQVAGYYEPGTGEFHLADWIDVDGQRPVMAHELTHALQDQHFNLRRFEHWPKGDSDAELAARALIEGDATLAMAQYVASSPLRALAFLKSMGTTNVSSVELEKAPRAVRESLLFPYQEGINWATTLHRRGGWDQVSKAFNELPQSTEQILHPEKYFAREAPVKMTVPDLIPVLNGSGQNSAVRGQSSTSNRSRSASARTGSGAWKRLDYDVQGEWGLYLILDQFLRSPAESRRAAAGWGGDRYAVYEGPMGQVLMESVTTWDTENDAREFFEAYAKRVGIRYASATPLNSTSIGAQSIQSGEPRSWQTSQGRVSMKRIGLRVVIVEGVPNEMNLGLLLKRLE